MSKELTQERINDILTILVEEYDCCLAPTGNKEEDFLIIEGMDVEEFIENESGISIYKFVELLTGCEDNWGYSDEYTTCSECGCLIKTSPDSYSWIPDYAYAEFCIYCSDCAKEYKEEILEQYINNPRNAVTIFSKEELEECGFELIDYDLQGGWYGRNDSPSEIQEALSEKYEEIIFVIDSVGQFHTNFSVMAR